MLRQVSRRAFCGVPCPVSCLSFDTSLHTLGVSFFPELLDCSLLLKCLKQADMSLATARASLPLTS